MRTLPNAWMEATHRPTHRDGPHRHGRRWLADQLPPPEPARNVLVQGQRGVSCCLQADDALQDVERSTGSQMSDGPPLQSNSRRSAQRATSYRAGDHRSPWIHRREFAFPGATGKLQQKLISQATGLVPRDVVKRLGWKGENILFRRHRPRATHEHTVVEPPWRRSTRRAQRIISCRPPGRKRR